MTSGRATCTSTPMPTGEGMTEQVGRPGRTGTHHIDGTGCDGEYCADTNWHHDQPLSTETTTPTTGGDMQQIDTLELQLSMNMDNDGTELTPARKAEIEAQIEALKGGEVHNVTTVQETGPYDPPNHARDGGDPAPHPNSAAPGSPGDLQDQLASIQQQLNSLAGGATAAPTSFDDVLATIDARDSDKALAMFQWLADNGRFSIIGNLNGGGYMLHYTEPKGTSKEGYTPGATQGGRMVDQAVADAKAKGAKPRKVGLCGKCFSAVEQHDDGTVTGGTDASLDCPNGGQHTFQG